MDLVKVLVVDDESRMRKLVHDFLAKQGGADELCTAGQACRFSLFL